MRSWRRLLGEFAGALERYSTANGNGEVDAAYWYREESLTAQLGAAATRLADGWFLVEFSTEGDRSTRKRKEKRRIGDLWLGFADQEHTVEAKLEWIDGHSADKVLRIRTALNLATAQLRSLPLKYRVGERALALVFCVPMVRSTNDWTRRSSQIFSAIERTFGSKRRGLVATYRGRGTRPVWDGYYYPGLVLVGESVAWGSPRRRHASGGS
jgi:hypothetical protein